ncbi:MAG: N-acetylglucosamine-6-phosphate deacetylase [Bacillota bacterium]
MKALINGKIILKDKIIKNSIIIFDKTIENIVPKESINLEEYTVFDVKGKYISPGFIDIHVHGGVGIDTMDANLEGLKKIGEKILENGVTSFLPTTMTMPKEKIYNALRIIRKFKNIKSYKGARALGAHLEGPFINPEKKGAQNEKYILKPNLKIIKKYLDIIKIITYAPEMDNDNKFIKNMNKYDDVVLSLGHSLATYEQAIDAINNGAKSFTHLFNAMTGLHHREPGMVGAAFKSNAYTELIADKIHVNKGLFQMISELKNDKLVLITDGMKAKCMKSGTYDLGGQKVIVDKNSARLKDNTLAGSILKMNNALKNMKENTNKSLSYLVNTVSLYPAQLINENDKYGSIEKNKIADLCVFNENFEISMTFKDGKLVYKGE